MKAILIDAVEKTVTEVDYNGELESAYSLLRCDLVDVVRVGCGSVMLVDDEGLLTAEHDDSPFILFRDDSVIAGSALVVGDADEDGDTTDCTYDLDVIASSVRFASRRELLEQYGIDPQPSIGFYPVDLD